MQLRPGTRKPKPEANASAGSKRELTNCQRTYTSYNSTTHIKQPPDTIINNKNEEGAVAFLNQEKAFNMVSFTTINAIFAKLNWPKKFRAVLSTTYWNNHIRAKVKANEIMSKNDFLVNSGTKQGCPLSPLIYMVVADLYNMAVINHKCFKGYETLPGQFVKISAYADDTAVHLEAMADIKIYSLLLCQYSLATGRVTNFNKSEGVLCSAWRLSKPNLGISTALASKYLGVTGCDSTLASNAIAEREACIYRQIDAWDARLSSSPINKVMVAKIMCLSITWYHAGIALGWEQALKRIKAWVQSFIWKGGIPKVAKATLRFPKNEGGLSVWSLVDKARAFTSMWVVKYLQNMTNLVLQSTIQAVTNWYASAKGITIPIWELHINHTHNIKKAGFCLLAMLQRSWAIVVRRDPGILQEDWVAYRNCSTHKQLCKDVLY
jgi:hypothetical protein